MSGPVRPVLAATALAVICGCAQTGRLSAPLAAFRKPAAERKAEADPAPFKPAKDAEKSETEKEGPGEAEVAAAGQSASKPSAPATPAAVAETKPAAPAGPKPAGVVHDAQTLALIEDELRHASPADRAKLYEEFKSLDGEMVRQLIRINRMVRDLETSRAATAALPPSQAQASANPFAPAGAALASVGTEPGSRVLNLGGTAAASALIPSAGGPLAQASPTIQPAGHSVPSANLPVRTAAVGHSTTRPIPVLDSVAGGAGVAANGPPAAPAAEGTASVTGPADDPWSAQLRQLVAVAESRAEQARGAFLDRTAGGQPPTEPVRKAYVESQVHLRLLYLMAGEQARAMQAIPGLDAADQEFWQQVLWGVSNYFDEAALPSRADRATQTVEQLRTAVTRLQGEANLSLRNVAFCHKITSFGNYEKFDRDEYSPGQRVLLYAEVANFKSVPQPSDGLYKTQLKSGIEFYRAGGGQPVNKTEFEPTTDVCRSYRQDYFHTYDLTIPSGLSLGPHVLKLTVEDVQTGKLATYNVNFTVK